MALTDASIEATQQTDQMLSKDTAAKKFVHEGREYPDTSYFRDMVARMERQKEEGPGTFKEAAQTIAEVAPITGDAIAMYELPEDMKNAFALIKQGYSEGDIKDMGLGVGYAALTAAGVVPGLGMGARVLRKGLRASLDDAFEQTGDLFRTASGMDDTSGLITVTDESVKITKPPKSVQKGPATFKFFGGDKGVSSDQKYTDYASSKKKAEEQSFDTDTDKKEFIFRDSKGTYVDPADNKFRYEIGTTDLKLSDDIQERSVDISGPTVAGSFFKLSKEKDYVMLDDILQESEVFKEYPVLRGIEVKKLPFDLSDRTDAFYAPFERAIYINPIRTKDRFLPTLAHEMQHVIDFFEDRDFGADLNRFIQSELVGRNLFKPDVDAQVGIYDDALDAFESLDEDLQDSVYNAAFARYSAVGGEVDARNVEHRLKNPELQFNELPTRFRDKQAPEGKIADPAMDKQAMSAQTRQAFAEPLEIGVSEFNVKNLDNPNIIKNYTVDDYNEAMRASNAGSTAGSKAKNKKINASVEEGTDVSVRLNLSSKIDPDGPDAPFNRMQTIHPVNPNTKKPNYSKADSYMNVVTVENGVFDVNQTSRRNIAETGLKVPAASVQGKFNSTRNVLEEGGDDIIEIGMNPQRQHLFTDVSNGQAVRSFDVATIIRDRVYAKGVKYWKKAEAPTPLPAKGDKEIDNQVRYKMKKGGAIPMDRQMSMFDDGGLMDEGGTIDPVSGNDVPPGSTQEEVRDDIPAQLSEGEFVFPADVVRYIGLGNLMRMRQEAKMGLKLMEEMGQMGNSEEATMPDDLPFDINDLDMDDDPVEMQTGGVITSQDTGIFRQPSQFAGEGNRPGVAPAPVVPPMGAIPQAASAQMQRPQTYAVPTVQQQNIPTTPFTQFTGGVPNVEFEMATFRNEQGQEIQLKIKKGTKGELFDPADAARYAGYKYVDPEATKAAETTVAPTTPQTTRVREEDPSEKPDPKETQRQNQIMKDRVQAARDLGYLGADEFTTAGFFAGLTGIGEAGQVTGTGYILDGKGNLFDPLNGQMVPTNIKQAISRDINEFRLSQSAKDNLRLAEAQKTEFGKDLFDRMVDKGIDNRFNEFLERANEETDPSDREAARKYALDVKTEVKKQAKIGNVGTDGRIINPAETARGKVKAAPSRPERTVDPASVLANEGPDRGDTNRQSGGGQSVAQTVSDMGSFDRPDDRGSFDARGGRGRFGGNEGGLASKPKPKAKKKMKRGGLASKK
jgi:hypothetical protein